MPDQPDDGDGSGELSDDVEEILYRVDERTKRIDDRMDDVVDNTASNAEDINELQGKVKRNTTLLNGMTVGGIAVITWIADKLSRLKVF